MATRVRRGSLLEEISRLNPWWGNANWANEDPQLEAVRAAPYAFVPDVLTDVSPPNLYTLRGPRRVGKSTVLKQTIQRLIRTGTDARRICYIVGDSLEDYRDLINTVQAVRTLFPDLADAARYFFVDEVTAVRDWQRGIKWLRDNTGLAGDCLVATGSSASDVAKGTVYLAGRRGEADKLDRLLWPMSFQQFVKCAGYQLPDPPRLPLSTFYSKEGRTACQEALLHLGLLNEALDAFLMVGGFPQAVAGFRQRATVADGFVRDLWDVVHSDLYRMGVSRPEDCLRLLEGIAIRIGSTTAMSQLGNEFAIDPRTASAWLDALANSYLLVMLYQQTAGVPEVAKQRKLYPTDPIIARLANLRYGDLRCPSNYQLVEAAAAIAIMRATQGDAIDDFSQPARLFYYRTTANREVDFLVLPQRHAAEAKFIERNDRRELKAMMSNFGDGILLTRNAVDLQSPGTILPAAIFLWLLA